MSFEHVPENWLGTMEKDIMVKKWLQNTEHTFPTTDLASMISYIKRHYSKDLSRMVVFEDGIPQSFVHWWCYGLLSMIGSTHLDQYPVMKKCMTNIREDHENFYVTEHLTESGVISVFKTWLSILYTDIVLYNNETPRKNVPRLYCGKVICLARGMPMSRRKTMKFIMDEGLEIFKERGFQEGEEYWIEICKKYKI
jgi:hypothetical protein